MREHCILSIETSGELCSVAVGVNGVIIDTITAKEIRNHAAQITQLIYNLMQKVNLPFSRLNAIATNKGPGSYTGLRIGAAVAKGLCYALNKPLIAVDFFVLLWLRLGIDEFGHSSKENGQNNNSVAYIAVLDARRNDVYLTMLDDVGNEILPSKKITVTTAADINFASSYKNINLVGNGAGKVQPFLPLTAGILIFPDFKCSANHLYQIATHYNEHKFVDMAYFEPAYL